MKKNTANPGVEETDGDSADEGELLLEDEGTEGEALLLTRRRVVLLIGAGIASYLFFLLLFLPFDGIFRYILKNRLPQGTRIEFVDLRPSLFGTSRVQGLLISREPGFRLDTENAVADLKALALLRFSPKGTVRLNEGSFSVGPVSGGFKSLEVAVDLGDVLNHSFPEWQGTVQVRLNEFEPDQVPRFPILQKLPVTLADLSVSRLLLRVTFSGGSFQINQGVLDSGLFKLHMEGSGRSAADPGSSILDARLCIKPVDDLESRNAAISALYNNLVGTGQTGGENCFKVTGPLASPSFAAAEAAPPASN